MSKREKIIIFITVTAVLYGLLDYFVFSASQTNEKKQSLTASQSSELFNKININLLILESMIANKEKNDYLLPMIEFEWKLDPFKKFEKPLEKIQESAITKEHADLIYSGFIKLGNKIFALINGKEYKTGEYIKDTVYKIVLITPAKVVFNIDEKNQTILYLKEEGY